MKMKLQSLKECKKRKRKEEVVASRKTSKPLPMDDESVEKEMKLQILLQSLKDLLSEYADCGVAGRTTIVNGCDTKLLEYVVETALTNFASPSQKEEEEAVVTTGKPLPMDDESLEKEKKLVKKCGKRKGREERKLQKKCGKRKGREEVVASGKTSKPLPMDESVEKEMKELRESDEHGYALPGCREVGRIIVSGYDASLPQDVVKRDLRNHFSSCGMITDVYVPLKYRRSSHDTEILCPRSYMYFIGEGAVEKALLRNGTDVVGGWTVTVKAYPFSPDAKHKVSLTVEGFDTSISTIEIERALVDLFSSSCVAVHMIHVFKSSARLIVKGEDAAEKVSKLDGSSFMGQHKLVVRNVCYRDIRTFHRRDGIHC